MKARPGLTRLKHSSFLSIIRLNESERLVGIERIEEVADSSGDVEEAAE